MSATEFKPAKNRGLSAVKGRFALLPLPRNGSAPWPQLDIPPPNQPHSASDRPASASLCWRIPPHSGLCLANSLRQRWLTYLQQLRRCRKDFSEDSVHQLRVATRRLMTQFSLLDWVSSDSKAEKARNLLKKRLKSLGELRDVHVQRMFFEQYMSRFPELAAIHTFLQTRERRLAEITARKVNGFKIRRLKKCVAALSEELTSKNEIDSEWLASRIHSTVTDAFEEVVSRRQNIDAQNSQAIHRTRVAFKRFRYIVESLSPAFTGLGKKQLRRLAYYQRRMGNLQDLEILQQTVSRFIEDHPSDEHSLKPFCQYLGTRHTRAMRACLSHADDLFEFWSGFVPDRSEMARTAA